MIFKITYSIYFVICCLYSLSEVFAGISYRHIFTVIMFIWCLHIREFRLDTFIKWYLGFLFFYGLSCFLYGYEVPFIRNLIGTHFAAIVIYNTTKVMIRKYDAISWIINTFLIVSLINGIVAILQFYGSPLASSIIAFLHIDLGGMSEFYERLTDFHGRYVGGLMNIVICGYVMSAASVLALYNSRGKITILNYVIFLIIFFALFLVQERSGFYVGIMCVILYLIIVMKKIRTEMLLFSVIVVFFGCLSMNYMGHFVDFESMRYVTISDESHRFELVQNGLDYFLLHPLGAYMLWIEEGNEQAHNVFVNAFLEGGIFGGLIGIGIVVTQIIRVCKIIIGAVIKDLYSPSLIICSIVYLNFMLNSFFHNPSILGGYVYYFVFWGVVTELYLYEIKYIIKK